MPKSARLIVILFVAISIACLWWYADTGQRFDSAFDLAVVDSVTASQSKPADALKPGPGTTDEGGDIESAATIATAEGIVLVGRVHDQFGQSISGLQIEISPKNPSLWQQNLYTAITDHSGEFRIAAIPADIEYRLEVLASGTYSGTLLNPFPIDRDMPPVTIVLDSLELVSVDGMIVDVDGAPVADFEILVQNIGIVYPGRVIVSDTSGFFQLAQFPVGELQLSTSGSEHFKIDGITLRAGEYRNLTLAIDKGSYHLSGWVSDEFNAPVAQARVVLTSEFTRDDYRSSSYRFRVTDSNGSFAFAEVGGQGHRLTADAIGYETRVIDHRFQSFSDELNIQLQRK